MTTEERFNRVEHITAEIAEQRPRDREEYKALWRDTQRHLSDLGLKVTEIGQHVAELAVETRLRIQELADESRAANRLLEERIASLVSAIGEHVRQGHPQ